MSHYLLNNFNHLKAKFRIRIMVYEKYSTSANQNIATPLTDRKAKSGLKRGWMIGQVGNETNGGVGSSIQIILCGSEVELGSRGWWTERECLCEWHRIEVY